MSPPFIFFFFFFNDTATTEIYTLSLHDALPISGPETFDAKHPRDARTQCFLSVLRSEEHTSELQSLAYLVCRLLLEKKKQARSVQVSAFCAYYRRPRLARHCSSEDLTTHASLHS